MSQRFDASSIRPVRWGELRQLPTGHWLTTWRIDTISLDRARLPAVEDAARDDREGFYPALALAEPLVLEAAVETTRWGMELDYYELTYRLFSLIDSQVGRIRLIQGAPRDWWRPFRQVPQNPA